MKFISGYKCRKNQVIATYGFRSLFWRSLEKVCQSHLSSDVIESVLSRSETAGGDEIQRDRLGAAIVIDENLSSRSKLESVGLVDGEGAFGELGFNEVDETIGTVEQEVHLGTGSLFGLMSPRLMTGLDTCDAERGLDLREVAEAEILKGIATPRTPGGSASLLRPDRFARLRGGHPTEVKERELVEQSVEGVADLLAMGEDGLNEGGFFQLFQDAGESSAGGVTDGSRQLVTGEATLFFGKSLDHGEVTLGRVKEGGIELLEFVGEKTLGGEAGLLNHLCGRLPGLRGAEVVGHASEGEVEFCDVEVRERYLSLAKVEAGLVEGEGIQSNRRSDAIVESALVMDHFADHPRGCRATDDEEDVVATGGPSVPKDVECGKKLGARGGEPGEFINEDDLLALAGKILQPFGEVMEGVTPTTRSLVGAAASALAKENCEVLKLVREGGVELSGQLEGQVLFEAFPDEKSFANAAASIEREELGFRAFEKAIESF